MTISNLTTFEDNQRYQINIAICGAISAGKSTLLNSLFVSQYSDMKIKRTTMTPQVYYENQKIDSTLNKKIREQNTLINKTLLEKGEKGEQVVLDDIQETTYVVPPVHKLVSLQSNVMLTIYDIPGLNDGTNGIYYEYLNQNFHKFDIILFIIDINSGLNTTDEVKILETILQKCKENYDKYQIYNKLLVLANKCDDMSIDTSVTVVDDGHEETNFLLDEEFTEMYDQIKTIVNQKVEKIFPKLEYSISPISCEDSYIYRMYDRNPEYDLDIKHVNKFGYYEYGKSKWNRLSDEAKKAKIQQLMKDLDIDDTLNLCGFNQFRNKLSNYLKPQDQYNYLLNHILYKLNQIKNYNIIDIKSDIKEFDLYFNRIKELNIIFNYENEFTKFIKIINNYLINYENEIIKTFICFKKENIKDVSNIEYVYKIKENIDLLCSLFQDRTKKHANKLNTIITNSINKVLVSNINTRTHPIIKAYEYIIKLFKHGYKITIDLTNNFFTNKNMMKQNPKEIIKYLNDLETKGLIIESDKIKTLENLLLNIYQNRFDETYIDLEYRPWASYLIDLFWSSKNTEYFASNRNISTKFLNFGFLAKYNLNFHLHKGTVQLGEMLPKFNDFLLLENYYFELLKFIDIQNKYDIEKTESYVLTNKTNETVCLTNISDSNYSYDVLDGNLSDEINSELGLDNTSRKKSYKQALTKPKREPIKKEHKPLTIPVALANLFDIEEGTLVSRTLITQLMYTYIKDYKLQDPERKTDIRPNKKLNILFSLSKSDTLTFLNIETYIDKLYTSSNKNITV